MTDPELADATYIEPITPEIVEQHHRRSAKRHPIGALLPTMGGQTALNTAMALSRSGALARYGVELIGANEEAIAKAEDRLLFRQAMDKIGLESPKSRARHVARGGARGARPGRAAGDHPAVLHAGRHRRRHRLQHRGIRGDRPRRPARLADARGAGRGIGARLEGIRDRGRPRPRRQLHHRLLDREHRSDGGAYRRFGDGRAGADPDRQGIPDHAQRRDRGAARDRRRYRRVERAVRGQPGRRPARRHRDEPARVALLGAGLEGDRLPDRQGRRQAGGRLHARRACTTRSPASRRPRSSRRSTTSSPRCRASPSRNSRAPSRCCRPR